MHQAVTLAGGEALNRSGRIRKAAVLLAGAGIYALLYALCSQIDRQGMTAAGAALPRFLPAFPLALGVLWLLFERVLPRCGTGSRKPDGRNADMPFCAAGAFLFLACCYGVFFLIQYPGSFMYDTQRQVFQIARSDYEMFHPLLHTLLIRLCLSFYGVLQSYEKCAALYSVIQLLVMAGCFSLLCASLGRWCGRRGARLAVLFFGLYPSHAAFASNCTKDGLFAAFFALFLALCFEDVLCGGLSGRRRGLRLAAGVLACLMRNNMVYALAVWAVCLLPLGRGNLRRAGVCVLAIALALGANAGLQRMTRARDGSKIEMLSVPIQQLSRARLYAPECFTDEEKALMDLVFTDALYNTKKPLYERYEPTLADPVKNYLSEETVLEHLPELAAMWARVGMRCPRVYLDAFLSLALPSLYPYSEYRVAQPYIETGLQPGVVTEPFGQPHMTQPGRFAAIRAWMQEYIFSTGADDIPVVRYLFNTGFVFWALLMFVLYDLYTGRWERLAVLLLPLLLWGTYLLGPVMQGRYLYPFICALPLFALRGKKTEETDL